MTTNAILRGKYPAKAHAKRVVDYITAKQHHAKGLLFLSGSQHSYYDDCDLNIPFRQRRAFMYLSGVQIPDCNLVYEIACERLTLFVPPVDPEEILWAGEPMTPAELRSKYDVDDVRLNTELNNVLYSIFTSQQGIDETIFTIHGQKGNNVVFPSNAKEDSELLKEAIDECRVVKDEYELALLTKAITISCAAHRTVMSSLLNCKTEAEVHGIFVGECIKAGAMIQAYPPIVASGRAAATMHPEDNDQGLYAGRNANEVLLIDAGAEWSCYGADVTRTIPISGRFTVEARDIYDIVLRMQEASIEILKEGVLWDDVHLLAHRVAIEGLLKLGILRGDPDEILAARTSAAFMPHGLGHFLGMDTHDSGGWPNPEETDIIFKYLRVRRQLPTGCVVTVEPGIHFGESTIRQFLDSPKHSQFINEDVLQRYWNIGGICIEDDVLVTKDGSVNLTRLTKDPKTVERIVQGN